MCNSRASPVQLQRRVAGFELVILLFMRTEGLFRLQYRCLGRAKQFMDIGMGSMRPIEEAGGS